jgi:hypothetical protein
MTLTGQDVEGILALLFVIFLVAVFLKMGDGSGDSQLGFGMEEPSKDSPEAVDKEGEGAKK